MRQDNPGRITSLPGYPAIGRRLFCKWVSFLSLYGTGLWPSEGLLGAPPEPVVVGSTEELASAWSFKEFTFAKQIEIRGVPRISSFPGIAIRLPNFSLYVISLVCPHEGCLIEFDNPLLVCPCHRSSFDPSQEGKVLSGPAPRPPWKFDFTVKEGRIIVRDLEPGGEMWGNRREPAEILSLRL